MRVGHQKLHCDQAWLLLATMNLAIGPAGEEQDILVQITKLLHQSMAAPILFPLVAIVGRQVVLGFLLSLLSMDGGSSQLRVVLTETILDGS